MEIAKAVVFDWAGTLVDFGSFAPMRAFTDVFDEFGVKASLAQAREPMGLPKRDHIAAMLAMPEIAAQWLTVNGAAPDDTAIDQVYATFVPLNERTAARHATLIPGALDTIRWLRERGVRIGSTTGYTRSIMAQVLPEVARQGFEPDNLVCADDLPEGRPGPLGMYQCFIDLVVHPPASVWKVDDTAPGIAEGVAAGCVTVGIALTGNAVGLTEEQLNALPAQEVQAHRERAGIELKDAGADFVIDTVADLPGLMLGQGVFSTK